MLLLSVEKSRHMATLILIYCENTFIIVVDGKQNDRNIRDKKVGPREKQFRLSFSSSRAILLLRVCTFQV